MPYSNTKTAIDLTKIISAIDPKAMLIFFWTIVGLIFAVSINIFIKVNRRSKRLKLEQNEQIDEKVDDDHQMDRHKPFNDDHRDQDRFESKFSSELSSSKQQQRQPRSIDDCRKESIDYMAKVMKWFDQSTNNNPFVNDITRIWLDSLNEKSCKSIEENGIFLEFVSLEQAQSPKLEQIGDSEQFNDNIITTMKASCDRLILQVRALPGLGYDVNRSAIYDVVLEKFSSLLKVICMTEQSIFVVRPLERPQTKAQIEGPILGSKNKYQPDVIINAVINVLSNTSLDLNFEKYCGFPKASTLITSHPMIGKKSQNKSNRPLANKSTSNIDQKLLIKVVKGYDLDFTDGDENENHQIYCTIEIDEPFNVCKSSVVRQNLQTPIWDQHFMVKLNERSREILFEVHDAKEKNSDSSSIENDKILGNAIVDVSDLMSNPSQVQNLTLNSGMSKNIFGYLVVEFLLMEHSKAPSDWIESDLNENFREISSKFNQSNLRSSNDSDADDDDDDESFYEDFNQINIDQYGLNANQKRKCSSSSSSFMCSLKSSQASQSSLLNLVATEIQSDLDRCTRNHSDETTTRGDFKTKISTQKPKNEYGMKPPTSKTIDDYRFSRDSKSNLPNYHDDLSNKNIDDMLFKTIGTPNSINNETNIDGHSTLGKRHSDAETIIRTKEPKSLIRNIKKRFSFNRRAKSVERQLQNRQSSISNGGDWDRNERARSVPGSREPSMPKETINQARRDESFGNLSQASVKTFTHEDSLLILECYDKNGAIKHYVISNESLPKKLKKLKTKKSVKLHLYKDHIFIAKHIASSKLCQICGKKFSLGLGKQAYQCRDCGLHCHKPCHVNVETRCFETSIGTLNLELLDNDQIFNGLIDSSGLTETIDRKLSQNNQTATIPELKITDTEDIVDGESHLITSPS